jgi:dihydrofolate synthase/folylpolyglutamate synthase
MDYEYVIDRMCRAAICSGVPPGLDNAKIFDQALAFPTAAYATVHVAGSNGKGSVATKIAKGLELSGYRVGLYTSPHLFSFCERIAIDGQLISEEEVVSGMHEIFSIAEVHKLNPTFFEMATFLAFDHFRKRKVDVAVIETGLGGRLDATNVICPVLAAITSISREHVHILGHELEQIASEKAGILKEKIPVVLGPKARFQAIYDRAKELNCPLLVSKKISHFYDEENSAVAEIALNHLAPHFTVNAKAIEQAIKIRPPCRFEKVEDVIFDVAHNPEAIFYLLQALHTMFPHAKFRFLVGFSKDKEYDQCLELIGSVATHIHLVQAETLRAAQVQELRSALKNEAASFVSCHSSIREGVKEAHCLALAHGEMLVICGSFYIMAEAKLQFQSDLSDLNEKIFPSTLSSSAT